MGCLPHSVRDLSQVKLKLIMKHSFVNSNSETRKSLCGGVSLPLLWLLGVPVPILVIIFLFRGCAG